MVDFMKHYIIIKRQEKRWKSLWFSSLLSLLLLTVFLFLNISVCKGIDKFNGILAAVAIFAGFFFNALMLLFSLKNYSAFKELRKKLYPSLDKPFRIGQLLISQYDYLMLSTFYVIGLGFLTAILMVFIFIGCYFNLGFFIKKLVPLCYTPLKISISGSAIFLTLHFFFESFGLITKFYYVLFIEAKRY